MLLIGQENGWKFYITEFGDNKTAQELLDKFAGKGTTVTKNKERVDFGKPIGKYYDTVTGQYIETNRE
nr:polymorphic toxin type 50 domain-containing protein [Psychrobacillus sp. AK 1817]